MPRHHVVLLLVLTACTLLAGCLYPELDPLPPVLQGASASFRSGDGCTGPLAQQQIRPALASSFDQRIHQQFPAGTLSADLRAALIQQGFKVDQPCRQDPTVSAALYHQQERHRGRLLGMFTYRADAMVLWKSDARGQVVWTVGDLFFDGLSRVVDAPPRVVGVGAS